MGQKGQKNAIVTYSTTFYIHIFRRIPQKIAKQKI